MITLKHILKESLLFLLGRTCPRLQVSLLFRLTHGRWIDWKHPRDINEKVQWLKFYGDTILWSQLADKYAVREYIAEKGLEHILIPLIGKWDKAEEIDWDVLPQQFVMKANHGCGDILICTNKTTIDTAYWTRQFSKLLKEKFGYRFGEPHYNKIKPCIIAEKLLDATKQPIPSSSLIDYKIWCFNGKPTYITTYSNRTKEGLCDLNIYDTHWNQYPQFIRANDHYLPGKQSLPQPHNLCQMLEIATILTKGFPCVRLDLYEVGGKVFFGEMTFTPSAGLNFTYTQEFLNILGDLCKLQ